MSCPIATGLVCGALFAKLNKVQGYQGMKSLLAFATCVHAGQLWVDVCTQADVTGTTWCDTSQPIAARAAAFVAALKPEEKVPIMTNEGEHRVQLHDKGTLQRACQN